MLNFNPPHFHPSYMFTLSLRQEKMFVHEVTKPNTISMFWQVPQYSLIVTAEILFNVSGMKFAFSQVMFNILANTN